MVVLQARCARLWLLANLTWRCLMRGSYCHNDSTYRRQFSAYPPLTPPVHGGRTAPTTVRAGGRTAPSASGSLPVDGEGWGRGSYYEHRLPAVAQPGGDSGESHNVPVLTIFVTF